MPRPKLQIVTDHILFPRDNVPTITSPHLPTNDKQLYGNLCVYMWVSKKDSVPFFIGIGTKEHSHLTIHRIPGTRKNTIQQMYREIVGTDFLSLIVASNNSYIYSLPIFKCLYDHYKAVSPEACCCNPPYDPLIDTPFLLDYPPTSDPLQLEAYRVQCLKCIAEHTVHNKYIPSSPESVGALQARRHYQKELSLKLQKQNINDETYKRYQEARDEARKRALGENQ